MDGKTARGASSPAKPALHMPEPLSTTNAATSSSHILLRTVQTGERRERVSQTSTSKSFGHRTGGALKEQHSIPSGRLPRPAEIAWIFAKKGNLAIQPRSDWP